MTDEARSIDYRDPEWLADKLGVDKATIYRYLQDGTLPGLQLARKWLVSERKIIEFLDGETDRQTDQRRRGLSPRRIIALKTGRPSDGESKLLLSEEEASGPLPEAAKQALQKLIDEGSLKRVGLRRVPLTSGDLKVGTLKGIDGVLLTAADLATGEDFSLPVDGKTEYRRGGQVVAVDDFRAGELVVVARDQGGEAASTVVAISKTSSAAQD